ncbi:MAG: endolytic transglycosylase MltG [Gammaproteobacteria bacterium]|nr:endolytic transglycosylase MltG [Gammaproteobacteria bacterium]MDH5303087.1 endolytic transglycosylase MltG [Gammaproteobacteria bacterium]MDH5323047.1 endolytic transglycosylase MltG [Gammaproteobacteria bacterium]
MRTLKLILLSMLVLFSAFTAFGGMRLHAFLGTPVTVADTGATFEIASGTSFGGIAASLEQRGIIAGARMLRIYARWTGQANLVQAGEYLITPGTTPRELLQQFTRGAVRLYSFTLIEGWNRWDLLHALHQQPELDASMTDEDWPALLESLSAATSHAEGLFLPETYYFPRNTSDRSVLRQAYQMMQDVLAKEWANKSESAVVATPYEALILASIIEKETARSDERERIAGVFSRRLEKGMRLQTDPTVIYGLGQDFNGNLTRKDLQTPTPYNTYTRRGLPPTPIAMPGRASIYAALHPAAGEEIFFVATGTGDGSHRFSTTKEEHDQAVAAYLQQLKKNQRNKD